MGDAVHRALQRQIAVPMVVALAPARIRTRLRESEVSLATDARSDPEALYEYVALVIQAWFVLAIGFGFLMGLLAYLGDQLAGARGQHVGIAVGAGLDAFAIAGAVYATALSLYVWPASSRYKRSRMLDDRSRRTLERAQLSDVSLLGQAAIGILAGLVTAARL